MARSQRDMKSRHHRPSVDTQAAISLARERVASKSSHPSAGGKFGSARTYPQLRVVERQKRRLGFRISHKMLLYYAVGFMALFAAIVMRAEMAATQLRLNAMNAQLTSLKTQHLNLEVELSSLQSPSRIVSYAETKLGMVYPSKVGYLGVSTASSTGQAQSTSLTPQVASSSNTLYAPAGEAGVVAPTRSHSSSVGTKSTASKSGSAKTGSSTTSTTASSKTSSSSQGSSSSAAGGSPSTSTKSG